MKALLALSFLTILIPQFYGYNYLIGFKVAPLFRRTSSTVYMGRASAVRAATKAKTDAAKAKNNCRYAKKIIIAVKAAGPDPESNRLLAQVISEAKVANVPKDIITRNIEKASSAGAMDIKESVFEFYGHGGIGLLVTVLTDNDNRASADVNLVAKKQSLKVAAMNSVKFKFEKKARLNIPALLSEDEVMELCLESGIDDYQLQTEVDGHVLSPETEGHTSLYVSLKDMAPMRNALLARKYGVECKLVSVPIDGYVSLSDADFESNMQAIDAFDSLDDVDFVEHNIEMRDSDISDA